MPEKPLAGAKVQLWGAQTASVLIPAACRNAAFQNCASGKRRATCGRQAGGHCRLAACAPHTLDFAVHENRYRSFFVCSFDLSIVSNRRSRQRSRLGTEENLGLRRGSLELETFGNVRLVPGCFQLKTPTTKTQVF